MNAFITNLRRDNISYAHIIFAGKEFVVPTTVQKMNGITQIRYVVIILRTQNC